MDAALFNERPIGLELPRKAPRTLGGAAHV
jgi:hypothetical protein